jgi:N-acetyl-1-D-myo-inositol-2-amino-2-deoxy-alpha-D-glucopyranoside deacetylase
VTVDGGFFALSNNLGSQVWGTEYYRLARGTVTPDDGSDKESDLFAGID